MDGKINQVRILPRGDMYVVEIIYEKNMRNLNFDGDRAIGIDLGLNNLVTIVNNAGLTSGIIKGGVVKSINQYYNKLKAKYQSIKDKQGYTFQTKRIQRMTWKRNNRINDIFHKISRKVIDYCILGNFGKIVIGYNPNWKQFIELGKKNNQNFVNIPYRKLINLIKYKAELCGIQVIEVKEWHTSKVSALDLEMICRHKEYLGKRIHRRLFQTKHGTLINADVNGALNILRKVIGDGFIQNQTDKRCWLQPKRWKVYEHFKSNPKSLISKWDSNCKLGNWSSGERVKPGSDMDQIWLP